MLMPVGGGSCIKLTTGWGKLFFTSGREKKEREGKSERERERTKSS